VADGVLIVRCSERSAEPESIGPRWDTIRFACQDRVLGQDFLRCRSIDEIPFAVSPDFPMAKYALTTSVVVPGLWSAV
jgi:hypothetical protein